MEEERVVLKQQKVQLNLLCAWNLIHKYQDPFGDCYFTQLKVDIRPLGAFQRTTYTDGVLTHAAAAALLISSICPDLRATSTMYAQGRGATVLYACKFVTTQTHNT